MGTGIRNNNVFNEQALEGLADREAERIAREQQRMETNADNGAGRRNPAVDPPPADRGDAPPEAPPPSAPPVDGVAVAAISSQAAVLLEIMRIKDIADTDLSKVAKDMGAINDHLTRLRALESKLRDLTGDGKFSLGELEQFALAAKNCGLEKEFETRVTELRTLLTGATGQEIDYKPFSSDEGVQTNSKTVDGLKEIISTLKDNFNGIQSELQVRLQLTMSKNNQADQLTSNFLTSTNQTANTIIGNIGRC